MQRIDGEDDPLTPASGPGQGFGAHKPGKKRAIGDFRGIKLSNHSYRTCTDPDALLARTSKAHPILPATDSLSAPLSVTAMCSWTTALT
jgi:hypothetical protein